MNLSSELTEDETLELQNAIKAFREYTNKSGFDPEVYLAKWRTLVSRVKSGYPLGIYDYTNELTSRDVLEQFSSHLTPSVQDKFLSRVQQIDQSFDNETEPTDVPLIGGPESNKQRKWWWHRIPKILGDELKEDYESFKYNEPRP